LRAFLESRGHTLVVTSDKGGPNSTFERELAIVDRARLVGTGARSYAPRSAPAD
jgi:hypothetical protein